MKEKARNSRRCGCAVLAICIKEGYPPGSFNWWIDGRSEFSGKSRTPLFDACRALKQAGEPTGRQITLFHSGSSIPSLITTVGFGADLTVKEIQTRGTKICQVARLRSRQVGDCERAERGAEMSEGESASKCEAPSKKR